MKIIKRGSKKPKLIKAECLECGTIVEEREDKLKWEHDRDGNLARERCPNKGCGVPIFFYR